MCWIVLKIFINILNYVFDLAWPKKMKLILEQQCKLSVLHSQYHACWCPGDLRNQGINLHGVDPQSWSILSPASEALISYIL